MRILIAALLALIGCQGTLGPAKNAETQNGYRVYVPELPPQGPDRVKILEWIDRRVEGWVARHPERDPQKLRKVASGRTFIIFDGAAVPGNDPTKKYNGFCWYDDSRIEAAIYWLYPGVYYDGYGLVILNHELDHALLGDFHPGTAFHGPY
jgi:hypothetical protein